MPSPAPSSAPSAPALSNTALPAPSTARAASSRDASRAAPAARASPAAAAPPAMRKVRSTVFTSRADAVSNSHVPGLSFLDARESVSAFLAPRGWGDEVAAAAAEPVAVAEPVDASGDVLLEVRLKDVDRVVGGQVPVVEGVARFTMVGMVADGRQVRLEVPVGDYVARLLEEVNGLKEKAQDVEIERERERVAWEGERRALGARLREAEAEAGARVGEGVGEEGEEERSYSWLGDRGGVVGGDGEEGKRRKERTAGRAALSPRTRKGLGAKKTSWGLLGAIGSPRKGGRRKDEAGRKKGDAEGRFSPAAAAVSNGRDGEYLQEQENVPETYLESPLSSEEDSNEGSTYGAWESKAWCSDGGPYDNVRSYPRRL